MAEVLTVKPSQAKMAIKACIAANKPVFVWGPPGIGKSDIVRQIGIELNLPVKDDRAILKDAVDLRGLPHINGDGKAHWAQPSDFPTDGEGIWFPDELNRAPVLVQNAYFQLILDRKLGEYSLPPGWRLVAAGNRESDGGGITRMPSGLSNRFIHLNLEVDVDEWCSWALNNNIDPMLIAFMRYRPLLLHQFDRNATAFPTPRSWEFVDKVIQQNQSQDIELALVAGSVGQGAAVEFTSFTRLYKNLPSIDNILMNPMTADVPSDVATLYAVSSALSTKADVGNFGRIIQYLNRISPEYAVFAVKDAIAREEGLRTTPEFTRWAINNQDLL